MASVWVWQVILTLFGLVCAAPLSPRDSPPIAQTHNGSYFGLHNDHFSQDYFLGVPFAKPPVGEYRLQVPQSLDTAWNGLRNATQYGYACIGYGEDTQIGGGNYVDEDCLSLNIVRPSGYENQSLPVGVWIYGYIRPPQVQHDLTGLVAEDGSKALLWIRGIIFPSSSSSQSSLGSRLLG